MAAFCRGEDHPRGVPVAPGGMPAGFAPEGSFIQPEAQLVSREALRTGHRGVGGRNQHHLPARPLATFGQGPLGRTDRGVRCWRWRWCAGDDERGVPVAKAVPVDADAGRFGRQVPGPDDRDGHAFRQDQPAGPDAEAPDGVLQRRERVLAALDDGPAAPLDLVRVVQGGGVGAQRLLLSDLRSVPEPREFRAGGGEQFAELAQRRLPAGLLLVDGFVPQPPAPAPLIEQRSRPGAAGRCNARSPDSFKQYPVFRGNRWRGHAGGYQALCREPAERLSAARSSPWLKPGVSRADHDEQQSAGPR